jgi:hypothetical protein
VAKRNITVQLEEELIREAKILAAKRSTSLSQLLADEITQAAEGHRAREAARQRAVALMREGFSMGGPPYADREELHDR